MQNNTGTLEIDCASYERAKTYIQAEVDSVVSGAINALSISQYRTKSQVTQAISGRVINGKPRTILASWRVKTHDAFHKWRTGGGFHPGMPSHKGGRVEPELDGRVGGQVRAGLLQRWGPDGDKHVIGLVGLCATILALKLAGRRVMPS